MIVPVPSFSTVTFSLARSPRMKLRIFGPVVASPMLVCWAALRLAQRNGLLAGVALRVTILRPVSYQVVVAVAGSVGLPLPQACFDLNTLLALHSFAVPSVWPPVVRGYPTTSPAEL